MVDPILIERDGHRTWLKWHRARRLPTDAVFTGARILEGMRLGASVEVDLVIHADHGCAILHNQTLEEETTGSGLVRRTGAAQLRQLQLRGSDGVPIADTVMLLEDMCALLAETPPHAEARLQLDFKETLEAVTPDVVDGFAAAVAPVSRFLIVSGGDIAAVKRLATAAPGLAWGYDPCYGASLERLKATGDYTRFVDDALAAAPDATMIYIAIDIILGADARGVDIVAPIHAAGRRLDAWTLRTVNPQTLAQVDRLLALKVDQITTDDPEGLFAALAA